MSKSVVIKKFLESLIWKPMIKVAIFKMNCKETLIFKDLEKHMFLIFVFVLKLVFGVFGILLAFGFIVHWPIDWNWKVHIPCIFLSYSVQIPINILLIIVIIVFLVLSFDSSKQWNFKGTKEEASFRYLNAYNWQFYPQFK